MTRRQDWPELLANFQTARQERAFLWAEHDCAIFSADWCREATGEDPLGDLRGAWTDEKSARLLLRSKGLRRRATEALGPEIAPALAQRGDVVLHNVTGRHGLGICVGDSFVAPALEGGLARVPMDRAIAAWRV